MQDFKIDLSGRVALVTGGGRGIGATISLALAQAGADVAITYNNSQLEANKIRDKIEMIGQRSLAIKANVGDTTQCKILGQKTVEVFNRVDILVGNAGISQPHQIIDTPDEEWERVMNVNARATFALARELLPSMIQRKFGRFITISSGVAVYGIGGASGVTYAASKAALIALTKGIAPEGAPYVTANVILPGPTNRQLAEERTKPIQIQENEPVNWHGIPIPISRKGIPEDIANACLYLASDEASFVTGSELVIDGGWTAQ